MEIDKIRATTDAELKHQEHELSDQLFRLKFQMKMGQTESLKKIRDLKKDIARMKTIEREKKIAGGNGRVAKVTVTKTATTAAVAKKRAKVNKAATNKTAATETK